MSRIPALGALRALFLTPDGRTALPVRESRHWLRFIIPIFSMVFLITPLQADMIVGDANTGNIIDYNQQTGAINWSVNDGSSHVYSLAVGPDGLIYYTTNNTVGRINPVTGANLGTFATLGIADLAIGLAFGPNGNLFVGQYSSGNVVQFNGKTGALMGVFAQGNGITYAGAIAFSPQGNLIVASHGSSQVLSFNGATGAFIGSIGGTVGTPLGLAFNSAGNLFVTSPGEGVLEFNGNTGASEGTFVTITPPLVGYALAFNPNGGNLFVTSGSEVLQYDGVTGANDGVFVQGGPLNLATSIVFTASVPEPSSFLLVGIILVVVGIGAGWGRRRSRIPIGGIQLTP